LIATLFKKGLTENLFKKGLIANLLKKGLTENPRNNVVYVTNRCNGCGTTLFKKGLIEKL